MNILVSLSTPASIVSQWASANRFDVYELGMTLAVYFAASAALVAFVGLRLRRPQ